MCRTILLAGVLLSVVALGSDSPKDCDDKVTADPLEGTWQLKEIEDGGQRVKRDFHIVLTHHGGTYAVVDHEQGYTRQGNYRIDLGRKLPHLDLIAVDGLLKGRAIKCIWQIEGDTLRVAYNGDRIDLRPRGFKDAGIIVDTYKRVK